MTHPTCPAASTDPWLIPTRSVPTTRAISAMRRRFGRWTQTATASRALHQVGGASSCGPGKTGWEEAPPVDPCELS